MQKLLSINNLHVSIKESEILKGVSLEIASGEIHAIMGPNGSGKSTLALTLMGHPRYAINNGLINFDGKNLLALPVEKRGLSGIFLAFQTPFEIEGISLREFLYQIYLAKHPGSGVTEFETLLIEKLKILNLKPKFVERHLNVGFSGGEKKQAEILQLAILQPKLAILDEIDSGLDVDALKTVCSCINKIKATNPNLTLIIITHYPRILSYLVPDVVHIMQNGTIVQSGTKELAQEIERGGYSL
ncbi:Fe-S cluster assembly ATPase SufC [Candidatus Dependentiae bacterium]|nr:Fe-S cluster assembly ATPase SufC [Candidatus Dependentiae bacterium]